MKMKNKNLKNVSLAIVDRDSIGSSGSGTINLKRHVFLLSARELCYDVENEGRELEYFNTPDYRICRISRGTGELVIAHAFNILFVSRMWNYTGWTTFVGKYI